MLLYGAPGTGKTLLARAIAGEAKVPIIHVVASKFAMGHSMVGVEAARMRGMFSYAKQRVRGAPASQAATIRQWQP